MITKTILIVIVLVLLGIIRKIVLKLLSNTFESYSKKQAYSEGRVQTMHTLARNFFQYFLFFVAVYSILTICGIPVGSLVAGAGIAGVAIGLGAQGFINDVLTGFFIIYERQLDVGDHVVIDSIEGVVHQVGLRTTQIKSFNGTMNYIPNREILIVSNLSRGDQLVTVDVRIKPDEDIERVKNIISEVNTNQFSDLVELNSEPVIIGLVDLQQGTFAIRCSAYAQAGAQFKVKTAMTTAYVEALTQAGIKIPATPLNLTM